MRVRHLVRPGPDRTGRSLRCVGALALAALVALGTGAASAQSYEQDRLQQQQYRSQQGLQRSTDQLNNSLQRNQQQLDNRATTRQLQQRQQIEQMQQQMQNPSRINPNYQ